MAGQGHWAPLRKTLVIFSCPFSSLSTTSGKDDSSVCPLWTRMLKSNDKVLEPTSVSGCTPPPPPAQGVFPSGLSVWVPSLGAPYSPIQLTLPDLRGFPQKLAFR